MWAPALGERHPERIAECKTNTVSPSHLPLIIQVPAPWSDILLQSRM